MGSTYNNAPRGLSVKTLPTMLTICDGSPPVIGISPHQGPVMHADVSCFLCRHREQTAQQTVELPVIGASWRHCNGWGQAAYSSLYRRFSARLQYFHSKRTGNTMYSLTLSHRYEVRESLAVVSQYPVPSCCLPEANSKWPNNLSTQSLPYLTHLTKSVVINTTSEETSLIAVSTRV